MIRSCRMTAQGEVTKSNRRSLRCASRNVRMTACEGVRSERIIADSEGSPSTFLGGQSPPDFSGLLYGLKPVPFKAGSKRECHRRCGSYERQPQIFRCAQDDSLCRAQDDSLCRAQDSLGGTGLIESPLIRGCGDIGRCRCNHLRNWLKTNPCAFCFSWHCRQVLRMSAFSTSCS